jgi:hypothetical protein
VAYDVSAIANHGPDAALNFPFGVEREIMSFLKETGVYVTIFSPEGEIERAVAGSPEAYAALLADGVIAETSRLASNKKSDGMKRKRGIRKGSVGSVDGDKSPRDPGTPGIPDTPGSLSSRMSVLKGTPGRSGAGRPKKIKDPKAANENDYGDEMDDDDNTALGRELRETGVFMPDARTLNRLISWLLTSETARLWKCESKDKLKALVASAAAVSASPAVKVENLSAFSGSQTNGTEEELIEDDDVKQEKKDSMTDIPRLIGSKAWQLEEQILTRINDVMDLDSISQILSDSIDPYETCEYYLSRGYQDDSAEMLSMHESISSGDGEITADQGAYVSPVGRICIENFSRGVPALTFSDCQIVSSALLLHGAPVQSSFIIPQYRMEILRNIICAPFTYPMKSTRMDSSAYEQALHAAKFSDFDECAVVLPEVFTGYTWADFQSRFCPWIDATLLCFYYVEIWLPFCASLTRRGIKPRETHTLKMIPLPYYNLSEHHPSNRGLCLHFLQRQQMLRACHFVLANYFAELWDYLRSPDRLICMHGLPVWWTPYVHDLGLVFACAKHGFLNSSYMREDLDLPFNEACIERHMRFFTQYGSLSVIPVALGAVSKDGDDCELWVTRSVQEFPTVTLLEARLERILDDLTKDLISSHPCRVSIVLGRQHEYGYNSSGARIGAYPIEEIVNNRKKTAVSEASEASDDDAASMDDDEQRFERASDNQDEPPAVRPLEDYGRVLGSSASSDLSPFASMISRGRSDSCSVSAPVHQVMVSATPLKDMLSDMLRSRRVHVSEFRPARPTTFEICEYSENLVHDSHHRDLGDAEDDSNNGRGRFGSPPHKSAKHSGYSNFKKGV